MIVMMTKVYIVMMIMNDDDDLLSIGDIKGEIE